MYDEEKTITLSPHAKARIHLVYLGSQHSRKCISQPIYFSRMNFNVSKSTVQFCLLQLQLCPLKHNRHRGYHPDGGWHPYLQER